ncbi:MAG: hypothetical protein KAS01_02865 [Candidatus Pacebacteria bacterium]|nr:hypothetical protein [Candidatus Paceibacterota bacterium]
MSIPTQLEKQIIATVVYYDILNYPLTSFEIFLYLIKDTESKENKYLLSDIVELVDGSEFFKNNLDQELGFYFLKGRNKIVQERLDRKKIWDEKWKKSKKIFWIMQIIPFTKLVMGSGSFSLGNTRKDSDVDLMIVAKWGRIWTVRTFFTLLTSLLRVRRYKEKTEDMICLNHYITDKSLRIPFESLYTAQLYYHILSIYDSKEDRKMFRKFQEENQWMKKYLENYEFSQLEGLRSMKRNRILSFISKSFEFILSGKIGDYFEITMSKIQSNRIKKDPLNLKKGGRITISDDQLEFHPDSHESHIIPKFNQKMQELGISEFANQKDSGLNI